MLYFNHEPIKEYFHNLLGFKRRVLDDVILNNEYLYYLYGQKGGRPRDVIPSSNEFAYRKRIQKESKLLLPFMSYKFKDNEIDEDLFIFKQAKLGVNISSLNLRVTAEPHIFHYEGLFVCNSSRTAQEVKERLNRANRKQSIIQAPVRLRNTDPFENIPIFIEYISIESDPSSNENDWLEKNNIRLIELSFDIHSLLLNIESEIVPIESMEFQLIPIKEEIEGKPIEEFKYDNINEVLTYPV